MIFIGDGAPTLYLVAGSGNAITEICEAKSTAMAAISYKPAALHAGHVFLQQSVLRFFEAENQGFPD